MSDRLVLVLSGGGENNAIHGLMTEFGNALMAHGLPVLKIELDAGELPYALDRMARGEVRFAVTWLGFAQEVMVTPGPDQPSRNLWDFLHVPLVKVHADTPAYFSDRHYDVPGTSVNLYMAAEFAHYRKRWMPGATTISALIPPFPMAPLPRGKIDRVKRRNGKLFFLKNGNSPAQLRRMWRERLAPSTVADQLEALADAILPAGLKSGALHIGDFVADFLSAQRIDPESAMPLIPFLTAQMDDYLRRIKSEMIATALLDLPVVVQGGHWEHVDFSGRRAQLIPGQDFVESRRVFTDELGIIDMSPNMDSEPHERVMRAAGAYSLVITNKQSWLTSLFPESSALAFEFARDSIRERVADVVAHPDRYLDMAEAFGERFREVHPVEQFVQQVVRVADLGAMRCSPSKPSLQNFFVWPQLQNKSP